MKIRSRRAARALSAASLTTLLSLAVAQAAVGAPPKRMLPDLVPQSPKKVVGPTTAFSVGLGVDAPLIVDGC